MVPKIVFWVVFAVFASALAFPNGVSDSPPQPAPPNSTSTTPKTPTTSPTTSSPTTTSPTTTSPTTAPSTSTSTTSPTPAPTTAPSSTTTAAPLTTPKPTPTPKPDVGKWNVTDIQSNITCILADMAIQLNVTYVTKDNKTRYGILDVPKNASAGGLCGKNDTDTQVFKLTWPNKDNTTNVLNFVFKKNTTNNRFLIGDINSSITPSDEFFPNIEDKNITIVLFNNETEFSTALEKSYRCAKEQSFGLMQDKTNKTGGTIVLSHVQIEAFHNKTDDSFGAAEDCEGSGSPDIVPIAVGCALVGLVAIVLIAYLVGRRRSQARGYLSM